MRYTRTAVALHWLLAAAIVASFCVGLYMTSLPFSPQRLKLYNWHKWAGVLILAASALRLLWRLAHKPPPDVPMPLWQQRAAHVVHVLLYLLFWLHLNLAQMLPLAAALGAFTAATGYKALAALSARRVADEKGAAAASKKSN